MTGEQRCIKFIYNKSKDYSIVYVNGASGGLNEFGEIVANLYFEVRHLPKEATFEWRKDGSLGKEIEPTPDDKCLTMERVLQVSLVLTEEHANAIGEWLIQKAEIARKSKAKETKTSKEEKTPKETLPSKKTPKEVKQKELIAAK